MIMLRTASLVGLALAAGCFAKQSIADNPGETDSDTMGDEVGGDGGEGSVGEVGGDDGDGSVGETAGDDGAAETSGTTGEMPGPVVEGDIVDCSTLPPGSPTVAGGELTALGFPEFSCNPRARPLDPTNTEFTCCSVDPAAAGGALPAYMGKDIDGEVPYFSGHNNPLGIWGMCVRTADIPFGGGLIEPAAASCPIPCNPTWDDADIETVCGPSRVCCQTHALQPADCVIDPDSGEWRPVTGADVGQMYDDGTAITGWSPGAHATHQDPGGSACVLIAEGAASGPIFDACVAALSVADQRGVCMSLGPGQACPQEQPGYIDACEQL